MPGKLIAHSAFPSANAARCRCEKQNSKTELLVGSKDAKIPISPMYSNSVKIKENDLFTYVDYTVASKRCDMDIEKLPFLKSNNSSTRRSGIEIAFIYEKKKLGKRG